MDFGAKLNDFPSGREKTMVWWTQKLTKRCSTRFENLFACRFQNVKNIHQKVKKPVATGYFEREGPPESQSCV